MAYSGSTLINARAIKANDRGMSRSESSAPQPSKNAAPTIATPESNETSAGLKVCALSVSARNSHGNGIMTVRIRGRYFFIRLFLPVTRAAPSAIPEVGRLREPRLAPFAASIRKYGLLADDFDDH